MQVFIIKILTIALSISVVYGIHCYECNSYKDSQCGDKFEPNTLESVNCDESNKEMINVTATFCRKIRQKVNDHVRIIRSCGFYSDNFEKGRCRRSSPSKGVEILTCECNSDDCNGGQRQSYANFYMLTISSIIYIVSKRIFINEAIKCYSCQTITDSHCNDPFNDPPSFLIVDCDFDEQQVRFNRNATICRKIKQTIYGKVRITRSCGYIQSESNHSCKNSYFTESTSSEYCDCYDDLCNGSSEKAKMFNSFLLMFTICPTVIFLSKSF